MSNDIHSTSTQELRPSNLKMNMNVNMQENVSSKPDEQDQSSSPPTSSTQVIDVLPDVPKSFYFTKHEFIHECFSVDQFVKTHRKEATLEQLREDLNYYLKVLRLSMIELINLNYSDFVNLSSNLVGLDKSIHNLSNPLSLLRHDCFHIQAQYESVLNAVDIKLNSLRIIRKEKGQLEKLMSVISGLDKCEMLMTICGHDEDEDEDEEHEVSHDKVKSLERIALLVNKLEVDFKCLNEDTLSHIPVVSKLKPKLENIKKCISDILESYFFTAITNEEENLLSTILMIYSLNGAHSELESLFRQRIVRPYMDEVICESFIDKHGIQRFFEEILRFIQYKCKLLIKANNHNFSFMINSVWHEIVSSMLVRTTSIFSPGNPDYFHLQYSATYEFIQNFKLESQLKDNQLESDSFYIELMRKFNLDVYYHIRFQQISTRFELILKDKPFSMYERQSDGEEDDEMMFHMLVAHTLFECLTTCWSTKSMFIPPLFGCFWKLTFQLLSRYNFWLSNLKLSDIKYFSPTNNGLNNGPTNSPMAANLLPQQFTLLYSLVNENEVLNTRVIKYFETNIRHLKPIVIEELELKSSLDEVMSQISSQGIVNVIGLMKECLVLQCKSMLKQVNDVPRLYRKTNREIPTKASNYILNCFEILQSFLGKKKMSDDSWKLNCVKEILEEITGDYMDNTREVLTSVQKIEDSLKRLKKAKASGQNSLQKSGNYMSDDDKIRLQIIYDIECYGKMIDEKLSLKKESILKYVELRDMSNNTKSLLNT